MRSFVLWYENKGTSSSETDEIKKEISVHINHWKDNNCKNKYYFDFGFMIEDITGIDKINLAVPFKVENENLEDLGNLISTRDELLNAIFNEKLVSSPIAGKPKQNKVEYSTPNDKRNFIIYSLASDQISSNQEENSLITINIANIKFVMQRVYFRFRIKVTGEIELIKDEIKGVNILSALLTDTEIIDFRFNNIRSSNTRIVEKYYSEKRFSVKSIHYLILRNASDIIIYNGDNMSSRLLENEVWKYYTEGLGENIVAYHIKEKAATNEEIDDFCALTRFQYNKSPLWLILGYIIITIVFGAVGSIIGNIISS